MKHQTLLLCLICIFNNAISQEMDAWKKEQDSIRTVILESKKHASIKESVLQELYVKDLVKVVGDSIRFDLPFDLHGLEGGAPDCYSTDITFTIPFNGELTFPEKIKVRYFENGCVDTEIVQRHSLYC